MTTADDLFDQAASNVQRLGLREIPFTESPPDLESDTLQYIFTGRDKELTRVFNLFQSQERRRILVYGRIGIGKSTFLREVLSVLRHKRPQMLTAYLSLPADLDLATTALIAVAREMPDDDWAQQQLYQMGIPTSKPLKQRSSEISAKMVMGAKTGETDLPITKPLSASVSLDTLLERSRQDYPQGVLIAIDDLDKRNPSVVRQMMHDAQDMLKGRAWFMLTGHPMGITGDLLTSERGLFDLQLKLEELDQPTTYKMLINYLNSVRIGEAFTDPADPRSVRPFLPETAAAFCEASRGKPRLFNRLGGILLNTAADMQVDTITPEVLAAGLRAATPALRERAALTLQEERVRAFLKRHGPISDDTITLEELEELGFRSFNELLPLLERLESADLAYQQEDEDGEKVFAPIPLPEPEEPPSPEQP
jgi:energy-coupling factor transporter ATP-binding protein EcfA2